MHSWKDRLTIGVLLLSVSWQLRAEIVYGSHAQITEFFVFSEYGGGDVGFLVTAPTEACPAGYWLRPSDPGFKSLYAVLMLAYSTKVPVRVAARSDSIWQGSTGTYCRVYYITAH